MTNMRWRPMTAADLPGVAKVAKAAFPDHPEALARFAERLRLSPETCWVLADGPAVAGYLIAYRWPLGEIPPLDSPVKALPHDASAFYLHDLALLSEAGGAGHAGKGIDLLVAQAEAAGARTIALVSVNDSAGFWMRHGFVEVTRDVALDAKLASYGLGARYMIRRV